MFGHKSLSAAGEGKNCMTFALLRKRDDKPKNATEESRKRIDALLKQRRKE